MVSACSRLIISSVRVPLLLMTFDSMPPRIKQLEYSCIAPMISAAYQVQMDNYAYYRVQNLKVVLVHVERMSNFVLSVLLLDDQPNSEQY
jgi:hypothetical protein